MLVGIEVAWKQLIAAGSGSQVCSKQGRDVLWEKQSNGFADLCCHFGSFQACAFKWKQKFWDTKLIF